MPGHRSVERSKCGHVSKISYFIKCDDDYRMPEPISALLWDRPLNQLTGRDVGVSLTCHF